MSKKSNVFQHFNFFYELFILGPAIGSALYLIVILFLKDDKEHIAEVERQLKEKRAAAQLEQAAV